MVGKYTTSIAEALATLQGGVSSNSAVVAVERVMVEPTANTGTYVAKSLGKRFPLLGLTGVIFGITFSGVAGTITYRPSFRSFQGNVDLPGDWNFLMANQSRSTDGDVSTGQLTFSPPAGYLFGQAGIQFQGDARGTMDLVVAALY